MRNGHGRLSLFGPLFSFHIGQLFQQGPCWRKSPFGPTQWEIFFPSSFASLGTSEEWPSQLGHPNLPPTHRGSPVGGPTSGNMREYGYRRLQYIAWRAYEAVWQRSWAASVCMYSQAGLFYYFLDSAAARCVSRIRGNWGRGCGVQSMSPRGITSHQRLLVVTELDCNQLASKQQQDDIICWSSLSSPPRWGMRFFAMTASYRYMLVPERELYP